MSCGVVVAGILLLEMVNTFFPLRESWCAACLAALGLGSIGYLMHYSLTVVSRTRAAADLATTVEATAPELAGMLGRALEIERLPADDRSDGDRALLARVRRETQDRDFRGIGGRERLRGKRLLPGVVMFVALAVAVLYAETLAKAAFYLRDLVRGQSTGVVVRPGDVHVREHSDVTVSAQVRRWETSAQIVYVTETEHCVLMDSSAPGIFSFAFTDVTGSILYHVVTPSLASSWHTIAAVNADELPVVRRARIRLTPPTYTGRSRVDIPELGDCSTIQGSGVSIKLEVDPEVDATFETAHASVPFVRTTAKDRICECVLSEALVFKVSLRTSQGRLAETGSFTITAEPDQRPVVNGLPPCGDMWVNPKDTIVAKASARDDFGLCRIGLSYSVSGGTRCETLLFEPPRSEPAVDVAAQPGENTVSRAPLEQEVRHVLDLGSLAAQDGDVVTYLFTAVDNREPDPQTSWSEVYFVEVRSPPRPDRSAADGLSRELGVTMMITELKRLIRMTWDVLAVPRESRHGPIAELLRAMTDLRFETQRDLDTIAKLVDADPESSRRLMQEAGRKVREAERLIAREQIRQSLAPQESALSKFVSLENVLLEAIARAQQNAAAADNSQNAPAQGRESTRNRSGADQTEVSVLAAGTADRLWRRGGDGRNADRTVAGRGGDGDADDGDNDLDRARDRKLFELEIDGKDMFVVGIVLLLGLAVVLVVVYVAVVGVIRRRQGTTVGGDHDK